MRNLGVNTRLFSPRKLGKLVVDAFNDWQNNNALRLSAALAYYSIFSIAPLLVLAVGLAGMFFGADAVSGHLYGQLRTFAGPQTALAIEDMVKSSSHPSQSITATVVGLVALLFGASGVFGQLKDALNTIWEVKPRPGLGWHLIVRERLLSFGMVLVVGFLLLVSFLLTTVVAAFNKFLEAYLQMPSLVWGGIGLIASFAVVTSLFALIFKVLPNVNNQWRHVWVGAAATALLFEVGKFGLAYYLGREGTASGFGAAGSVVLLLLWVYYASCILLFGAEFTKMFAIASGDALRPLGIAVPLAGSVTYTPEPAIVGPTRESLPLIFAEVEDDRVAPAAPTSGSPILQYAKEHMAAGMLGALGCGLVAGLVSRALPRPESSDPGSQMKTGLKMLSAASLLLLTQAGRDISRKVARSLERLPSKIHT